MNNATTIAFTVFLLVGCSNDRTPEFNAQLNELATSTVDLASTDDEMQPAGKMTIALHTDGFPTGNDTPEGAAADLTRAFINQDAELFHQRRWVVACEGYNDPSNAYKHFLAHRPTAITTKTNTDESAPSAPQRIAKLYAARPSTKFSAEDAATSKVFGAMGHEAFVDVVTVGENGTQCLSRVSVSQRTDKKWYAAFGSLHDHESESTTDFSEVYKLPAGQMTNR